MTGKIKLTQEQADAIEGVLKHCSKERLLNDHSAMKEARGGWSTRKSAVLNDLSVADMARSLYIGYEIEPKYKAGDWVVFESKVNGPFICVIEKVYELSVDTDYLGSNGYKQNFGKELVRHATPEEIHTEKERRWWAEIGREVGEFKDGDVGIVRNGGRSGNPNALKNAYEHGDLVGFYPVESFISFEEVEPNAATDN